ncbi:MAG: ribosome hibernation-promoting factor, HPF/YfiA family [Kiloniellaceae bacterium]
MQLSVKGKQLDVGDALRTHVDESLSRILDKYFGDALEVAVTLSREAHLYRAVISAHVGRGIQLEAQGEANEPYPAFDAAAERLSKRLRRYKRRLRDHNSKAAESAPLPAQQYILAGEGPEENEDESNADGQPAIVAEMTTEIPTLTVSEAVMRMDLGNLPAMMFRNSAHGGLNMIYQRSDGNIGWLDPRGNRGE